MSVNLGSVSRLPTIRIETASPPGTRSAPTSPIDRNHLSTLTNHPSPRVAAPRSFARPFSAPSAVPTFHFESKEPDSATTSLTRQALLVSEREALGSVLRPPPPLFRPTTFWRNNPRSGVTSAAYSPSSHLIRRSTFIAAGLILDHPIADLSALCVESRVGIVYLPPELGI